MQRVKSIVVFCAGRKLGCIQSNQSLVVFWINFYLTFPSAASQRGVLTSADGGIAAKDVGCTACPGSLWVPGHRSTPPWPSLGSSLHGRSPEAPNAPNSVRHQLGALL